MDNILFSIVTVSFNSAKTIEKTILSILNQDIGITKIEYLIIDGGSTDGTIDIIKKYENKIPHLIWISEKDKGIYDAMNKGIMKSSGEIIGIVNSDDWLESNTLSIIFQEYQKTNDKYTLLVGGLNFHYVNGTKQYLSINEKYFKRKQKHFIMPVRHPSTFVPKIIYDKVGIFDISFSIEADCDFIYRCIENNMHFKFISLPLSNMLDGGVSNSPKFIKKCIKDRKLFYEKRGLALTSKILHLTSYSIRLFSKILLGEKIIKLYRHCN